jgi:hypothetical protein
MIEANRPNQPPASTPSNRPRDPKLAHLAFLRWLAERGRIEHVPLGPPSGRYAARLGAARLSEALRA